MSELSVTEERNIRRVLKENAMTLIWVTGVVFSFIMFVVIPQQETKTSIALIQASITTIEKNHMAHLQGYAEEIADLKAQEAKDEEEQTKLMQQLIKIDTLLEEYTKNDK